ncbi:hypothetical protein F2Q70_00035261 [Brassica cretica]|uniref:DUF1985 domain-containing protein n=1 Tax=Brassica cretica TaxID=69181 RepID=A0A8S9JQ88_BRACR|nr:hypothetical protein F2Q70_00035261 [Brassica cretica]KAF3579738.1 hypothetical protein DY000_02033219 [Brassica cretica]
MAIRSNHLKFLANLVHSFLCKELITSKLHEKCFVFARTPLWFSLQEYHDVTGLKISRESKSDVVKWKDDGDFWSKLLNVGGKISLKLIRKVHLQDVHKWTRIERLRLIYLCVIMGVVMGRDEKVNIPHMYIKLVMDLDKVRKFHWGLHSFDFLLSSIDKTRKKFDNKETYILEGFTYAFQIWIMEAVPDFGEILAFCLVGQVVFGHLRDSSWIRKKFDWSETDWAVLEPETSEMEEVDVEAEPAGSVDDTNVAAEVETSASNAAEVHTSATNVAGRGKRKIHDEGAESRKKKLLCQ